MLLKLVNYIYFFSLGLWSFTIWANNTLSVDEELRNNQYLESSNGDYRFYLQGDGNLVLRDWRNRDAFWSSRTHGKNGTRLILQSDANLVLYTSNNQAVWASNTDRSGADRLVLNNDGSLVLYADCQVVWSQNGTGPDLCDDDDNGGTSRTFRKRIANNLDDVEERADGSIYTTSSDLELVFDNGNQTVGLRFTDIRVPRSAEIVNAYIQFTVDEPNSNATNLSIHGESRDSAAPFTTNRNDVSSRTKTSASVNWQPRAWNTVGEASADQRTPSLAAIVKEITRRNGWRSGNDMVFMISGTGERTAESHNGSSGSAPLLHIEYRSNGDDDDNDDDDNGDTINEITYTRQGGVNRTGSNISVPSTAQQNEYEIVTVGGSSAGGGNEKPIDARLMETQSFRLIGVRGTADKKSEIWIRKNTGQDNIRITGNAKDVGWSLTTIKGNLDLDFDQIRTQTHSGTHGDGRSTARLVTPGGQGFTFVAFFFDDSTELTNARGGEIIYTTWGFGDGDGVGIALYQPNDRVPDRVDVFDHDNGTSGGEQYVSVAFSSGPLRGADNGDDGGNDDDSDQPVKIAFIGDTGAGSNFQQVLNLIKREGADLTVVSGDTSYSRSLDDDWDSMVRNTLGSRDPVLIAAGNHDYGDSNFGNMRSFGQNRLNRSSAVRCTGQYAEKMSCRLKNIYIVLSSVGSGGGSLGSHESYIRESLSDAPSGAWRICAWHKNQRDMQVGGKSNEVGWGAYEICREKGAIIATGHEHSYSRTHLLSDMSEKRVVNRSSQLNVGEGKTFAFVSGLGGISIRDQERAGNWWAKIYTSTQGARYGAMFGTFYKDRAEFYFKNIANQVIDRFTVQKEY